MTDLPAGWAWANIDDVQAAEARAITDGPFGSNLTSAHYTPIGARVIRLQNIGEGSFIDEKAYISIEYFDKLRNHEARGGDVLLASLGSDLPKACVMPHLEVPAIVKADCIRLRPHAGIDARWLVYAMSAPQSHGFAAAIIRGIGRPRLGLHGLRRIPIPIPPQEEQRRLCDLLDGYLSRVDSATQTLISITRDPIGMGERLQGRSRLLRLSLLQEAFAGRMMPQDPRDEPAPVLLERIQIEQERVPKIRRTRRPASGRSVQTELRVES